ncbi:hypothetical protein HYDPIDRAFT_40118 [Hydnomerulius pinastri MD-312]|uniref:DUF6534 domain-containing protein n=1 Tax=Hydnomerulius pinastri MD-312 TaxID=994086 RepID=A0A0C9W1W8_9AGAM|nr:hypothetical protein HYDPIDRAFT_40118 [Hydnomerulius pinastri MD-312]
MSIVEIPGINVNVMLGPLILAPIITAFLFGCAVVQTYVYYKKFPNDIWQFKGLVAFQMWVAPCDITKLMFDVKKVPWDTSYYLLDCSNMDDDRNPLWRTDNAPHPTTHRHCLDYYCFTGDFYFPDTSVITSMAELVEGVCYLKMPDNYIWIPLYAATPGMYANSLLAALNSRTPVGDQMRSAGENPEFCRDVLAKSPGVVTDSDLPDQKRSTRPAVIQVSAQVMNPSSQESLDRETLTDIV